MQNWRTRGPVFGPRMIQIHAVRARKRELGRDVLWSDSVKRFRASRKSEVVLLERANGRMPHQVRGSDEVVVPRNVIGAGAASQSVINRIHF